MAELLEQAQALVEERFKLALDSFWKYGGGLPGQEQERLDWVRAELHDVELQLRKSPAVYGLFVEWKRRHSIALSLSRDLEES